MPTRAPACTTAHILPPIPQPSHTHAGCMCDMQHACGCGCGAPHACGQVQQAGPAPAYQETSYLQKLLQNNRQVQGSPVPVPRLVYVCLLLWWPGPFAMQPPTRFSPWNCPERATKS